jgi:molybdenum cofactor synthesis domain-containing protein
MVKTAAILIIGNEILSGKVKDDNSHFLASELRELGVDVRLMEVLPDDVDVIAEEVSSCSRKFDLVFTSGGVGPTHDDVTMYAIAKGFGLKTVLNENILKSIEARCGEIPKDTLKMAEIPEGAEVIETEEGLRFPPVVYKNVYIFPGIPEFLKRKFSLIKERFRGKPYGIRYIYVNEEECFIASFLEEVVREFQDVEIGSYPKVSEKEYKVMLTIESKNEDSLKRAFEKLLGLIPSKVVVRAI